MPAAIILLQDEEPLSEFPLGGDRPLTVGRSSTNAVQVHDPKLSRHHCEVRATGEGYFVRDLGSKNGTFVNGARVTQARLRNGDRIQVGLTRLLFRCEAPAPSEETRSAPPHLCASCGKIVSLDDLGTTRQTEERIYCSECIEATPLLGRTIGGYEVVQVLGRGSMGAVYKAEQLSMSRPVALKILHRDLTADEHAVRRFLREARAGGQFSHPNIIRIYDMNQAEGYYFISMEYLPGGDVGALLEREGPLPVDQVRDIATQTCSALAHAHAKGVIHRDIKPSNLLLGRDGLIKVADLGLAKSLDAAGLTSITSTGTTIGTLVYVPPEQIADAHSADHRADIYSLGATCYHLLSGHHPFRARSVSDLARAIREEPAAPLDSLRGDVPPAFAQAIARAMAKRPDQRFQAADEMLGALEAVGL
ncbi:MAG: protein kinase domain-containing protein [Candidatus Brocadiia bacterium]